MLSIEDSLVQRQISRLLRSPFTPEKSHGSRSLVRPKEGYLTYLPHELYGPYEEDERSVWKQFKSKLETHIGLRREEEDRRRREEEEDRRRREEEDRRRREEEDRRRREEEDRRRREEEDRRRREEEDRRRREEEDRRRREEEDRRRRLGKK